MYKELFTGWPVFSSRITPRRRLPAVIPSTAKSMTPGMETRLVLPLDS
jgi:hypothetical protein